MFLTKWYAIKLKCLLYNSFRIVPSILTVSIVYINPIAYKNKKNVMLIPKVSDAMHPQQGSYCLQTRNRPTANTFIYFYVGLSDCGLKDRSHSDKHIWVKIPIELSKLLKVVSPIVRQQVYFFFLSCLSNSVLESSD